MFASPLPLPTSPSPPAAAIARRAVRSVLAWALACCLVVGLAGGTARAAPSPTSLTWDALPATAARAFDAGPGRALDARAAGLEAARRAVPGDLESLDVATRWERAFAGPTDFEVGLDAVITWRLGRLADARRGAWQADAEALAAERDLARFRFTVEALRRFAAWWERDALAAHLTDQLREQGQFIAPLHAAADKQLVSRLVVTDLEVELARLDLAVATAHADARAAAREVVGLLGGGLTPSSAGLADLDRVPELAFNPWSPARALLAAHPALRALAADARAADAHADAAQADGPARLQLGAGFRQAGADTPWGAVIVGLSVPLENPAADHAARMRAEARALVEAGAWHLRELELELELEAERFTAAVDRLTRVRTALVAPMSERVLLLERAMLAGRASLEQLIRSRRDLLEAHHALVTAAADVLGHHLRASALTALLGASPQTGSPR